MAEFAGNLLQTPKDPDVDRLFRRIERGSTAERDSALAELLERARRSSNPDDWNSAALGAYFAGRPAEAIDILDPLVNELPDRDIFRLNLATFYSQTHQINLCRYHLRYLAEKGMTEEIREIAGRQLEGYERFLGLGDEDRKLRDLQINSLRRSIERRDCEAEAFLSLTRLLVQQSQIEGDSSALDEALSVMEKGAGVFPENEGILEFLVAVYLRKDPANRLHGVLKQLERIAPDSDVLKTIDSVDHEASVEFSSNIYRRAMELLEQVNSGNEELKKAALADLKTIVATYPENHGYRTQYGFALLIVGDREAALEQANRMAGSRDETHAFHFNLGQLFSGCGVPEEGRHHLKLALRYAQNDEERQDVYERVADLEKR